MQNLLQLKSISVSLDNKGKSISILDKIDLDVPRGKMVAIVGPSGSGKTTLLMACAGLLPVSGGQIIFEGQGLPLGNERRMTGWRQKNLGIIFQNFHLLPSQTALENVSVPLELKGEKPEAAKEKAGIILTRLGLGHRLDHLPGALSGGEQQPRLGLGHRLDHLPGALSGGEQQRVALGRAIAVDPPLLLADEPTGNLDQENGRRVMDLLDSHVRDRNATLLLITHDPDLAGRCDMQVHILDGKITDVTGCAE